MQSVTTQKIGNILVIVVNNPPVNALSWHVRQGLSDGVDQGLNDSEIEAMVLRCDGSTFIAGADITEFGKPPQGPDFNQVLRTIESATKPIVGAIHGTALGGGLETALVCHYRIAVPSAKLCRRSSLACCRVPVERNVCRELWESKRLQPCARSANR
jgi:3-hydroxyacyl-CoA dehydrogenase